MKLKESKSVDLGFMLLEVYPQYVISTIKEGKTFDIPELKKLFSVFYEHYGDKPFVSIANRKYDYTINPTCFMKSHEKINLLGIGVVSKSTQSSEITAFERNFFNGPFEIFDDMETSIAWAKKLLKVEKQNKKADL